MDELKRALEWHKQAVPNPTVESACIQVGCHFEEVEEMIFSLDDGSSEVRSLASKYKSCEQYSLMGVSNLQHCSKNSIELLDSLCDQIVTAAGVAHSLGFDLIGALKEVNDSNYSKFVNGKAVFDKNGKIDKPEGYRPPQLERFTKGMV